MKERPIIFNAPAVLAILEGRKTQTRPVVEPKPADHALLPANWGGVFERRKQLDIYGSDGTRCGNVPFADGSWGELCCPYGLTGDRLWVQEAFCCHWDYPAPGAPHSRRVVNGRDLPPIRQRDGSFYKPKPTECMTVWYGAEGEKPPHLRWESPDRMPRWASRITLEITDVRVERLQSITDEDARAEGVTDETADAIQYGAEVGNWREPTPYRTGFSLDWECINGPDSWDANPWVWVLSFHKLEVLT